MDIDRVPPARALPPARRAALHQLLTEEVARTAEPWWRRSRRAATVGVGAAALVLAGGAASAGYVMFRPATELQTVWCYDAPSLDENQRVQAGLANDDSEGEAAGPIDINDPVSMCSQLWQDGVLPVGAGSDLEAAPNEGAPAEEAPSLTACTLNDGIAAVFPGDENTCTGLNLPRLQES